MFSFLRRHKPRIKTKRQQIAEHAAALAFLRSVHGENILCGASVIGEDEHRCVVEVMYGISALARPPERRFFSVEDVTGNTTQMPFDEARKNWGAEYER